MDDFAKFSYHILKNKNRTFFILTIKLQFFIFQHKEKKCFRHCRIDYNSPTQRQWDTIMKAFDEALKAFKSKNSLIEWFDSQFYDLVHFPQSFYLKASEVLGVDESKIQEDMEKATQHIKDRASYGKDISIKTQITLDELKNQGTNVFGLMCAKNQKTLLLQDIECFVLKPRNEVIKGYGEIIKKHFQENAGVIPSLGEILGYSVMIWGKEHHFSPQGEVVEVVERG